METWRSGNTSKILPVNVAEELSMIAARETAGLKPTEEQILLLLSRSCPQVDTERGVGFLLSDFVNFMKNLKQAISTKDSSFLLQKRGLRVDKIVSIEEFCTSSAYMNQKNSIRPLVLAGLIELFDSENSKRYIECVLTGAIRWGKCVLGSTTFYDGLSGRRMTVAEAATTGQSLLVPSLTDNGKIKGTPATATPSGKKKCLTITFSGGHSLTVSKDHPFRVRDGYCAAYQMDKTTWVACARHYPEPDVPLKISDEEVLLVSYLLSDGGCTSTTPNVTNASPVLWTEIERCTLALYKKQYRDSTPGLGEPIPAGKAVTRSLRGISWLVSKYRMKKKAIHKRVPAAFYGLSNQQLALFLNRFFACDGSIYCGKPSKIEVCLASEKMIDDIQFMLRRLGIVARKVPLEKTYQGKSFPAWRLQIADAPSILSFLKQVGFILSKEDACRRLYAKTHAGHTRSNPNWDIVPITPIDIPFRLPRKWQRLPGTHFGRKTWEDIVETFPDIPYAWLADSDLVWEHPVKIEDAGLQEVYDLCVPETGNFVAEGVVIHNTYFSYMAMAYMVYYLSCFHNPQLELDMAPGSTISLIQQSQRYELAKKVIFEQFAQILKLSPYFAKSFPPDLTLKSELRFPNNIVILPVGGSDTAVLGMNTIFAVIDEMNFMLKTKSSERMSMTGAVSGEEYDHAERVYTTLVRRMKAQYIQKGGTVPGKLLLISSSNYPGDFTDRKLKEAQTDKSILPLSYTQWEVLPPDRFSGKKFLVEVGNEYKQSRIVRYRSEAKDEGDLLEVPIEYQKDFERDIESALKDYAGRTTGTSNPFIPYRELIAKAQDDFDAMYDGQQLFLYPSIVIDDLLDPNSPDWEQLINMDFIENSILAPTRFTAHIDVGVSEDAAGISIGHLLGYKLLPSSKYFDPHMNEFVEITDIRAPIYCIDGTLQVKPPVSGRQIDLALIRDMILWLRGRVNLHFVTMDSYQSTMMIQAFRRSKIRSGILSVDTSIEPYAEVKQAIKDERIFFPKHLILAKELRELEKVKGKDKVDHPTGGCFTGATKLMLLEGGSITYNQLVDDHTKGIEYTGVTYNQQEQRCMPAILRHPRKTKEVLVTIKIEFDDGSIEECTVEHPWLLATGIYVEAQQLTIGDRVMALDGAA